MSPPRSPAKERSHGMLVVDFDGTLLRTDGSLAPDDIEALVRLGDLGMLRVIATGRSPFSYRRAMGERTLPVDFIVFSSGAATARMPGLEIVRQTGLTAAQTARAARVLLDHGLDFMIHDPVPENHRFSWHRSAGSPDFERRLSLYPDHRRPLAASPAEFGPATQLLAIIPGPDAAATAEQVSRSLGAFSVIRATSPLDGDSLWLEVFPRGVSKSSACAALARRHGTEAGDVLAIGNDYNDLDVLRWAGTGFVTANAPPELRAEFPVVAANDHGGVAEAVRLWLSA